jgi:hypothetical protein
LSIQYCINNITKFNAYNPGIPELNEIVTNIEAKTWAYRTSKINLGPVYRSSYSD